MLIRLLRLYSKASKNKMIQVLCIKLIEEMKKEKENPKLVVYTTTNQGVLCGSKEVSFDSKRLEYHLYTKIVDV